MLFLLKPIEGDALWDPWFNKAFGFVVRANDETEARRLAQTDAGDEGELAWASPEHSTCVELLPDGPHGIVIRDFSSA